MDWTSSARVCLLAGVPPLGLRFLLFGAEKSTLRSRNFPTALALDFHHYPLYGQKYVWGLLARLSSEGSEGCFCDFLYRIAFTSEVNAISIRKLFFNPSHPSFRDFSERQFGLLRLFLLRFLVIIRVPSLLLLMVDFNNHIEVTCRVVLEGEFTPCQHRTDLLG